MDYLLKYMDVMKKYRKKEFCDVSLSLYDILLKADCPDLFDKMSLDEIEYLINNSSGFTKYLFLNIKKDKINKLKDKCLNGSLKRIRKQLK